MKRTIYTLLLLIGAVALTTACDKSNMTGSKTANVIGKWAIESVEFYYDGQKVNYNPNVNCIAYIDSDGLMQLGYSPLWSIQFPTQSFSFSNDGGFYYGEMKLADWSNDNGNIVLTNQYGNAHSNLLYYTNGHISNGKLYLEKNLHVRGYRIAEDFGTFINNSSNTSWISQDGNLHEFRTVTIFSR